MTTYETRRHDGLERGIQLVCPEHGEKTECQPGRRRVALYCSTCGIEVEVQVHDAHDWRDRGERC